MEATDAVIPATTIDGLMRRMNLPTLETLMLALLPEAQALARPLISGFRVGAVGRERETGDLVLGANVEFPGATLAETIHAEQFLFSRAFHRGASLDLIAVSARPCGHCRQFMAEFAGRETLMILGASGDRLSLAQMLPWSFTPTDLGEAGAIPAPAPPRPAENDRGIAADIVAALEAAGGRAHAPYSRTPSAIVLRLTDGAIVSGGAIENAAYNPGLPALQAALVNLIAMGRDYDAIAEAVLGTDPAGLLDHAGRTRHLLGSIAPQARFVCLSWRSAPST